MPGQGVGRVADTFLQQGSLQKMVQGALSIPEKGTLSHVGEKTQCSRINCTEMAVIYKVPVSEYKRPLSS